METSLLAARFRICKLKRKLIAPRKNVCLLQNWILRSTKIWHPPRRPQLVYVYVFCPSSEVKTQWKVQREARHHITKAKVKARFTIPLTCYKLISGFGPKPGKRWLTNGFWPHQGNGPRNGGKMAPNDNVQHRIWPCEGSTVQWKWSPAGPW